jgi:uncharacterized LabA/DUF88 family protein
MDLWQLFDAGVYSSLQAFAPEEPAMQGLTRFIFFVAMLFLTVVSMWTTYVSLRDSILPEPLLAIPMPLQPGAVWQCSVFALLLSVAIGLMLFGLKMAIIDEQKRLNLLGIAGLTVVGFISIAFNMDVLYRTADKRFFIDYSSNRMTQTYEEYLARAQTVLQDKRNSLKKETAKQEAELESEVEGIRRAPAGYGTRAKEEDYKLRLLESENSVELETIDALLAKKAEVDVLLATSPQSLAEIEQLQDKLRVGVRDIGVAAGLAMPPPVKQDSPIFAVFSKLSSVQNIGMKEVFFLLIAFFLDLGDIIGYSLVPNARRKKAVDSVLLETQPASRAEYVPAWESVEKAPERPRLIGEDEDFFGESRLGVTPREESGRSAGRPSHGFRIRPR